jgi:hypothetical protein
MSNIGLFILGALITVPAAAGVIGLLYAAVLDGREEARIQAQREDTTHL